MTEIDKSELKYLLQQEANGNLSSAERLKLDEWYNAFDTDQKDLEVFRDAEHEQKIRERLFSRIMQAEELQGTPYKSSFRRIVPWLSTAAAIALITIGSILWRRSQNNNQSEILLTAETGNSMLKEIKLDDGSEIWLNAGSKLRYPEHFSGDRREVYLEGEAYFDIVHNSAKSFIVHAPHLNTNVLGTAFSVTAYKDMPFESVTVVRGKVGVSQGRKLLGLLTPNKRITYNPADGKNTLSEMNASATISWTQGKLNFENQDIRDIAGRLSRWYGYKFSFVRVSLKNKRYTASFDNNTPLREVLKVLKAITLLNYKMDEKNKTVTFLGTGRN